MLYRKSPVQVHGTFLAFFENPEVMTFFLKSTDSRKFDLELILQEKSIKNLCRQMQTVLDLSLRAMSMIGLILKNYPFPEKKTEFLHKIAYGIGQDISCIKFLVVRDFKVIFK